MRKYVIYGSLFFACGMILGLVACDDSAFAKKDPKAAAVIEQVVEGAETVGEDVTETELKLPAGSLKPVFDHKVFNSDTIQPTPVAPAPVATPPTK